MSSLPRVISGRRTCLFHATISWSRSDCDSDDAGLGFTVAALARSAAISASMSAVDWRSETRTRRLISSGEREGLGWFKSVSKMFNKVLTLFGSNPILVNFPQTRRVAAVKRNVAQQAEAAQEIVM